MKLEDFQKDFHEEVKATAATQGEGSSAAFLSIATNYLINAEVISDFNTSFYTGNGKKNRKIRVDGYVFDEFDNTMNLIVADYTGDITRETVTKSYAQPFFDRLEYFMEEAYGTQLARSIEPSTPASDLIDMLRNNKERIRKYRLILLSDGFMSKQISELAMGDFCGKPIEYQIWDIERIYKVCISSLGRQDISIDFEHFTNGQGIPCLEASGVKNEDYKSFLCIIPGNTLADIYDQYGSQLLEGNVRSFLSTKVAVNKKIRETVISTPENFFAYNNGVSATAIDLKFKDTENGRYITYAKDFQIINGGQTTASLSSARFRDSADLTDIYVQMKLTEVEADVEKTTELIRNISRSSNSQNKVSDADFFATHPFHVRMEQISRRIFAPASSGAQFETKWFYERARGQYLQSQMQMTKSQKDRFMAQNPKKQLLTKTDLAKYRNTWSGYPHVVSRGAQTNFIKFAELIDDKWNKDETMFNEKYFRDSVSLAILFKHTEYIVSHQPWFENGYRANIVTYSLSLLHYLIKKQFNNSNLDLQVIWNKQQIPDQITMELIRITEFVFRKITDPKRQTVNVTQWCKREACWEEVKKCPIELHSNLNEYILKKEENMSIEHEAKKEQILISEIEAQTKVLEFGAPFWKAIDGFVKSKRINLSDKQILALKYATQIPNKIPSSFQSTQLLLLKETAESNGFKM